MESSAHKTKSSWNISKSTYFSLPPKRKRQRHYWYQVIGNGKVKRKFTNKIQGKCTPCLANNRTLCCKRIVHTTTFRSNQTNRIFHIYHNLNCKSKYVIYLLECTKCKTQYIGKAETEFNIRLNNHRKDVWKPDAIPASHHFQAKTITSTHMQNSY